MVAPILVLNKGCGIARPYARNGYCNRSAKVFTAMAAYDLALFITSLVVGILSITATINLSLQFSYSLIGVSGLVALSYGVMIVKGMQMARANDEREKDDSRRLVSRDITDHFKVIPHVLRTICHSPTA